MHSSADIDARRHLLAIASQGWWNLGELRDPQRETTDFRAALSVWKAEQRGNRLTDRLHPDRTLTGWPRNFRQRVAQPKLDGCVARRHQDKLAIQRRQRSRF